MSQLPPNLPHVITVVAPYIDKYGYFGVAGLLLLESTGIPVPGETTLIAASVFASIGHLNIFAVIIIAIIAAVLGDNIAFIIGKYGGIRLIEKFGKYIFIDHAKFLKIEAYMNRRGGRVVIVARFIDGLRQLNGIIAGSTGMEWHKFFIYNVIGATLWVCTWAGLGYLGGNNLQTILRYQIYVSITAVILIIAFVIWKLIIKRNKNKKLDELNAQDKNKIN